MEKLKRYYRLLCCCLKMRRNTGENLLWNRIKVKLTNKNESFAAKDHPAPNDFLKPSKEEEAHQVDVNKPTKLLNPALSEFERVCFASYPRTGNTLLRSFVQGISGITTGSD